MVMEQLLDSSGFALVEFYQNLFLYKPESISEREAFKQPLSRNKSHQISTVVDVIQQFESECVITELEGIVCMVLPFSLTKYGRESMIESLKHR